ncbi:Telomere repeat-binding factor 3-like protein [Drosera capensis]
MADDKSIDKWVLEYLLHKPISDPDLLDTLLTLLPIQSPDPRLTKTLLLRRLESDLINHSVSESTLDLIESIQKLDWVGAKSTQSASDAMKAAYCAVAVECTVRHLGEEVEKNREYFEVVKRVWRGRVGRGGELVGEEMVRVKEEMEDAIWDEAVCARLRRRMERKEGDDGLENVRVYLKEAWEEMGQPVLRVLAGKVEEMRRKEAGSERLVCEENACGEEKVEEMRRKEVGTEEMGPPVLRVVEEKAEEMKKKETGSKGSGSAEKVDEMRRKEAGGKGWGMEENACREIVVRCGSVISGGSLGTDEVQDGLRTEGIVVGGCHGAGVREGRRNGSVNGIAGANKAESKRGKIKLREKHIICPSDRLSRRVSSSFIGVTITNANADEMDEDIPMGIPSDSPDTAKFWAVREGLKCSSMNLHKVVDDPLPGALQAAEEISIRIKQGRRLKAICANKNPNNTVERTFQNGRLSGDAEGSEGKSGAQDDVHIGNHFSTRDRVLYDHELDDFRYNGSSSRPHLSTPKSGNVSPLDFSGLVAAEKFTRRRKRKMWTPLEEDALRVGVDKFGAGNWKMICNAYREILKDRTDVDLKDKWRNLTKHEKSQSCGS